MTHAYCKTYLECARRVLGGSFDCAVHELGMPFAQYVALFCASGYAGRFACGEPAVVVGVSGAELASRVVERVGLGTSQRMKPAPLPGRGGEYWAGWALAYYQWQRSLSFERIFASVPADELLVLYGSYHEMDIRHFVDRMDELCFPVGGRTRLKAQRLRMGLTQRELAEASGVPLRTLQQYEQRQKNINACRSEYLVNLAAALCCHPSDLLEGSVTYRAMGF